MSIGFNLESILAGMSEKEIQDLNNAIDNFDPVAFEKREAHRKLVLGINNAVTMYMGKGKQLTGVTKWNDTRDGREHELKTYIKHEVFGTKKFKNYWHITTINGRYYSEDRQQSNTIKEMKETHERCRTLIFFNMKIAYGDDPNTDFNDVFYKNTPINV